MNNKGFTLVELLAVIVILAALALITTTSITKILKDSKDDLYDAQLIALKSSVESWAADNLDKLPEVDNCAYLTLKDLKEYGIANSSIKNPKTNEEFPEELKFKITTTIGKKGNKITNYEVDSDDIEGCTYIYEEEETELDE